MVVHPATPLTWRTLIVPKSEKGADGVTMTPQEFKKEWGRLLRETAEEDRPRHLKMAGPNENSVLIGGSYAEKS
jgi:hypothetical protein